MSHSSSRGGKGPYTKRQNQNAPSEVDNNSRDVEKKVKQIAEMFGDWKKTDIQRCLEENSFDVNLVVQKKVDGKEDWTTVEKKEIRTQKPQRGRGGRGGGRGGSRGGSNSPSTGSRSGSTSTTQQPEASTNDKPIKKKPTKQDKNTSSEVRNFSVPENEPVEETKPQTQQQQQPKVLSYSEAVAAFKKKEDEEKKKLEDEKHKIEQQAKEQKDQQVKSERNQRKKKGDKNKAPKEEVKETVVPEPVQQPQPVVEESIVEEEEVPEEEFANEEEEVEQEEEEEEEQVEEIQQQQPTQPIQQQQPVAQNTYQNSFEQQRQQQQQQQQEEQPQLQMPSGLYNQAVSLQFGTLEIGSQPKTQSQNSVNQPNAQTNPQMQNGQYWNDPTKMHNFIPYIPNQYPYHPQYYPYIYQYYQPSGAQGVNANKNYNQAYYQQEGFAGMYNQVSGTEETEQAHQDPYQQYQMQQPYFLMYPQQQQQQQQQQQMETKHKSESPQNDPKVNPYPTYLPGYQNQYPQSYVFGHPNQMMYPHYPTSGNNTGNPSSTTSQPTKKW